MALTFDPTNINSFFDWMFHSLDTQLFGHVGITLYFLLFLVVALVFFFNANKFTATGFVAVFLIGLGSYGYTIVGWIAPLGAMMGGLVLGLAMYSIFS